jgi:hypothetical protein
MARNGMTVWLDVELYSTWSPGGRMCLVTCSNIQYMARNEKSQMYMVRITYLSKHSRFRKIVTLYLDHWSRNNVVGVVTRLLAGRFGV